MSLTYRDRGTSGTQWEVVTGNLVIGSIRKNTPSLMANKQPAWDWTLNVSAAPPGFLHHGRSDTLEEAKAQLERNWRAWLDGAGLDYWPWTGGSSAAQRE